jgi:hypothetical protein
MLSRGCKDGVPIVVKGDQVVLTRSNSPVHESDRFSRDNNLGTPESITGTLEETDLDNLYQWLGQDRSAPISRQTWTPR